MRSGRSTPPSSASCTGITAFVKKPGGRSRQPGCARRRGRAAREVVGGAASFAKPRGLRMLRGVPVMTEDSHSPATLFDRMGGRAPLLQLLKYFYADVRQ